MVEYKIMQKVGDRDNPSLSVKECAFTIPANPMSDRQQMVIEFYGMDNDSRQQADQPT